MQMIDVLKRLAELDAANLNIVKENTSIEECGMMPTTAPKTPATINITADNGEELGNMLGAIMKLAGIEKVEPHHLGAETEPATLTAEPSMPVGPAASAGDEMRSVIDKINVDGEDDQEETDESRDEFGIPGVDTTPNDPTKQKPFTPNEFSNQENSGNQGDRMDGNMPKGRATFESLMDEYRQFLADGQDTLVEGRMCKTCKKPISKCKCD
jgi:hypothetical protein